MIHISTAEGQNQPEVISPGAIARGHGDGYILRVDRALAALVHHREPFAFGEWGMWGSDNAGFAGHLFSWIRHNRRVRMVQYNQGDDTHGPFRLYRYPRATRVIRHALKSSRSLGRVPAAG